MGFLYRTLHCIGLNGSRGPCVCPERLLSSPEVNNWTVVFDMNAISIDLANSFDDAGHVLG